MIMDELERRLREYKLAILEAFGLDPEQTASSISVGRDSIEFVSLALPQDIEAGLRSDAKLSSVMREGGPHVVRVEVLLGWWNDEQREAVKAYLDQFPGIGER